MQITLIIVLSILVIIEGLVIWALLERQDKEDIIDRNLRDSLEKARAMENKWLEESDKWRSAYLKEKKQSDNRARRIESIYRGEVIRMNKLKNT